MVREVGSDYIFERTSLNGQKHGLERFIDYSSIRFTLYKEGQQLAYIEFNDEFKMKDKFGKLLDRLPIDFNAAKLPIDALEYKANHAEEVKEKVLGIASKRVAQSSPAPMDVGSVGASWRGELANRRGGRCGVRRVWRVGYQRCGRLWRVVPAGFSVRGGRGGRGSATSAEAGGALRGTLPH